MNLNRTEKEQVRVHIRWMIRRDMPEVLQTEQRELRVSPGPRRTSSAACASATASAWWPSRARRSSAS